MKKRLEGEIVLSLSKNNKTILAVLCFLLVSMTLIITYGKYSETEIAIGYIKPESGALSVISKSDYTISEVKVRQGDFVEKGDVLFLVITSKSLDKKNSYESVELKQNLQKLHRIEYQLKRQEKINLLKVKNFEMREDAVSIELKHYKQKLKVAKELLEKKEIIWNQGRESYEKGKISIKDYFILLEDFLLKQAEVENSNHAITYRENDLQQILNEKSLWLLHHENDVDELKNKISDLTKMLAESEDNHEHSIKAPGSGYITKVELSPGQHIKKGSSFASIIPLGNRNRAEVYVTSKAISFIEPGQEVLLEYDSFPAIKYGRFKGKVVSVDSDITLPDETINKPLTLATPSYRVLIELNENKIEHRKKTYDIKTGSTLKAYIITSEKTIIEWMFRPLIAILNN